MCVYTSHFLINFYIDVYNFITKSTWVNPVDGSIVLGHENVLLFNVSCQFHFYVDVNFEGYK